MSMIPSERHEVIRKNGGIPTAMRHADIAMLVGAMKLFAWLNLVQGILNIIFYSLLPTPSGYLLLTGILSVVMCVLVYMKIYYMMHTKNWIQISVTAMCGLYLPIMMLVVSSINMATGLLK